MSTELSITYLATQGLTPYTANARTHSSDQIDQIAASIREFGWTNPVLIDENRGIIAGHGRVMAAEKLGIEHVPCIKLSPQYVDVAVQRWQEFTGQKAVHGETGEPFDDREAA